ncbi:hypothetical protein N7509_006560 [Penicillium cosmopolitanum]|uniref:Uncharacterized protein n=1 Tax=Penicillium cosmopolitanum TaxID=1131564 RepID=A0A9X0B7G2_9EURO|nr:uncharacterized protein N7509_006560 [Penicillium cosmopolitanum]KAJ5391070.1 hypothetical protein N7509_006560 [Penicillium cosmopolitanum]
MLANAAVPATCSSTSAKYSLVSVRRVAISASAPNSSRDRPFDENPAIDASTNLSRSWGSTRRTRTLDGSGRRASRPSRPPGCRGEGDREGWPNSHQ